MKVISVMICCSINKPLVLVGLTKDSKVLG